MSVEVPLTRLVALYRFSVGPVRDLIVLNLEDLLDRDFDVATIKPDM